MLTDRGKTDSFIKRTFLMRKSVRRAELGGSGFLFNFLLTLSRHL